MYKNQDKIKQKCGVCGKVFEGYVCNALSSYKSYCSLECEYTSKTKKKHTYEVAKEVLDYCIENIHKSDRTIAKLFNVSKDYVNLIRKKYTNREPKKLKYFNRDYFNKIDTEHKAYWLGFLFADGYVCLKNKRGIVELTLKSEDLNHIEKFAKELQYNYEIEHKTIKLNNKSFEANRLTLCSYELAKNLSNLGCVQNKSLILKFPNIEDSLIRHFMRGYVDGDGCLGIYNNIHFSVLGTVDFLEGFADKLKTNIKSELGVLNINKHNNIFQISKSGNYAKEILFYLYNDSNIYLDRKYNVYKQIITKDVLSASTEM